MPSARLTAATDDTTTLTLPERVIVDSDEQEDIYGWFADGKGNLVVNAFAGTGKTTTILRAIGYAPEKSILVCAFNKRIQEELAARLTNPHAEALTLHALGYRAIRDHGDATKVNAKPFAREDALASYACAGLPFGAKRLVSKLVTKAREIEPLTATVDSLIELACDFGLYPDADSGLSLEQVARATVTAMDYATTSASIREAGGIDFADMIFLPLRHGWIEPAYDLVVVDEAQDMTVAQLELAQRALRPGGRFVVVGDRFQAIYGFRGADCASIERLQEALQAAELPLTTTYRCPHLIVEKARAYVPGITATADAPAGIVDELASRHNLPEAVRPGDFILSRMNAPLARVALHLLRRGIPTKIQGRDIGQGLASLVRSMKTDSLTMCLDKLAKYEAKQCARLNEMKKFERVEALMDKCDTLRFIADGCDDVAGLLDRLAALFTDEPGAVVICSSVHKAKGLEADRVFLLSQSFFLKPPCAKCRRKSHACRCGDGYEPDPKRVQEERNIYYVALTRSKRHLTFVQGQL